MYKYRTFSIVYKIFSFPVCQRTFWPSGLGNPQPGQGLGANHHRHPGNKSPASSAKAAGGTKRLVVDIKLTPINYNTTELSLNQVQL